MVESNDFALTSITLIVLPDLTKISVRTNRFSYKKAAS